MEDTRIEAALHSLSAQRPRISPELVENMVRTVNALGKERERRSGKNADKEQKSLGETNEMLIGKPNKHKKIL